MITLGGAVIRRLQTAIDALSGGSGGGDGMWKAVSSGSLGSTEQEISLPTTYAMFTLVLDATLSGDDYVGVQASTDDGETYYQSNLDDVDSLPHDPTFWITPLVKGGVARMQPASGPNLTNMIGLWGVSSVRINKLKLMPINFDGDSAIVTTMTGSYALFGIENS